MRVLVATGGTGGHIYPAVAVAHALERCCEGVKILFTVICFTVQIQLN